MKTKLTSIVSTSLLLTLIITSAGCHSTGYNKSDTAALSLQMAAAEVQAESRALDVTLGSLKELIAKPAPDLKPQFRTFSASLDRLVDTANRAQHTGVRMQQKNVDYLQAWDKELQDMNFEHVRKNSETRRTEVSKQFETVNARYQEAGTAMQPLILYLTDIRRALSADLTHEGLEAVKPIVQNADENATKVQAALAKLASDLNLSGSRISSVALQTAEPPQ